MATRLVWSSISLVRLSVFLVISSSTVAVSPPVTSHSAYSPVALDISVLLAFSLSENAFASVSASDLPVILGALEDRVQEALNLAAGVRGILSDDQVAHWQGEARPTAALIEDLVGQAWPGVPQTPEIWIAADLLAKLAEGSS